MDHDLWIPYKSYSLTFTTLENICAKQSLQLERLLRQHLSCWDRNLHIIVFSNRKSRRKNYLSTIRITKAIT